MKSKMLWVALSAVLLSVQPGVVSSLSAKEIQPPLYPVTPLVVKKGVDVTYPSVAGDFMVFSTGNGNEYNVERVSKHSTASASRVMKTMVLREAIRFGVAVSDGSVGYVSNRTGPISSWMWLGNGESHAAIGHMGGFSGSIVPFHLNASQDGKVWCFDTSLQKLRQNTMLAEFIKNTHHELTGQLWRTYDSDNFRYKQGYSDTKPGKKNDFDAPVLYVFNRVTSQLNMIPNAFNGTVSSDGQHVVFVRETNGNYDLWMQTINGEELVQLTDSKFADLEPQFNPDGSKILFVSNRAFGGAVTKTSLYMMDLKSYKITRLTNAKRATDGGPAWLDDDTVVFHSNRSLKKPQEDVVSNWNIWQLKLK